MLRIGPLPVLAEDLTGAVYVITGLKLSVGAWRGHQWVHKWATTPHLPEFIGSKYFNREE